MQKASPGATKNYIQNLTLGGGKYPGKREYSKVIDRCRVFLG